MKSPSRGGSRPHSVSDATLVSACGGLADSRASLLSRDGRARLPPYAHFICPQSETRHFSLHGGSAQSPGVVRLQTATGKI